MKCFAVKRGSELVAPIWFVFYDHLCDEGYFVAEHSFSVNYAGLAPRYLVFILLPFLRGNAFLTLIVLLILATLLA